MMIKRKEIERRIDALTRERDDFIDKANARIADYNGRLAELQGLLQQPARRRWWKRTHE